MKQTTYAVTGASGKLGDLAHVAYRDLSVHEYEASLRQAGLAEATARFVADLDASIAAGDLETTSHDLDQLLGRSATPVNEELRAANEALIATRVTKT